jgi:hypothetical protein
MLAGPSASAKFKELQSDVEDQLKLVTVGTDGICLPSHRLALDSRNEGLK